MDTLIDTFHLDLKLFIAQLVNFGIVFGVLYWFALKPLVKTMADRTKKIEQGLQDAKDAASRLDESRAEQLLIIKEAKKEAQEIVEKARVLSDQMREEMIAKAKEEIGVIINQEKSKMQQEKAGVLKDIKADVATMVISSIAKILPGKLSVQDEKDFIKALKK